MNVGAILEKFKCISALSKSIIFESNVLIVYVSFLIYFLIDHHCKTHSELTEMFKNSSNLQNFLQGGVECIVGLTLTFITTVLLLHSVSGFSVTNPGNLVASPFPNW